MVVFAFVSASASSSSCSEVTVEGNTMTRGISLQKENVVIPSPKNALSGRPFEARPSE